MTPLPESYDAVVVGAGPNGLVAANHLLDAGWTVLVLEAQPKPGGAVRIAMGVGDQGGVMVGTTSEVVVGTEPASGGKSGN